MENSLTYRFKQKVDAEKLKLKPLAAELDIPYDRMYKWYVGKGNPKYPDSEKIEKWINGTLSNDNQVNKLSHLISPEAEEPAKSGDMVALYDAIMEKLERIEASLANTNALNLTNNSLIQSALFQLSVQESRVVKRMTPQQIFASAIKTADSFLNNMTLDNETRKRTSLKKDVVK